MKRNLQISASLCRSKKKRRTKMSAIDVASAKLSIILIIGITGYILGDIKFRKKDLPL